MEFKETTQRLYEDIRKEYFKWSETKEFGVKKYSDNWIFCKIGEKFYKSPKTIENIVFSRF